MRFAPFLVALPALVAAQQEQVPILDQIKGWLGRATQSISSAVASIPSSINIPENVAAGAARHAQQKVHTLTLANYEQLLQVNESAAAPTLQENMIFVTGGNKTCYGRCAHAETAWNESIGIMSVVSAAAPKFFILDCEKEGVLCQSWVTAPPEVLHVVFTKPCAEQPTPKTDIRYIPVNATHTTASTVANLHLQREFLKTEPYDGFFQPFHGPLAKAGLNVPMGYVIWGFTQIPSWGLMIAISLISRTMVSRRMANPNRAGGAQGGAPAAAAR